MTIVWYFGSNVFGREVSPALEQSTVFLPPDHLQVHLGSPGHISAALADDTRNKKKTNILPTVYLAAPLVWALLRNSLELVGFMANWLLIVVDFLVSSFRQMTHVAFVVLNFLEFIPLFSSIFGD